MSAARNVAILGAGIMGVSTALMLARRGCTVALFDAERQPFFCASRWNEGKIHLGFMYANDRSLNTARRLLPGALSFHDDVEELIGFSLRDAMTHDHDIYLIHKSSVISADLALDYYRSVMELVRAHPDQGRYLTDLKRARIEPLGRSELSRHADTGSIKAGFRIPECSVSTVRVADLFLAALASEPRIIQHLSTRVIAVRPQSPSNWDGPWSIETDQGSHGPFDAVVNALWQGRLAVDQTLGLPPPAAWSHRYRLALFVRTREAIDLPCMTVTLGPYGDIKSYGGRSFYLSWYPAGLVAEGNAIQPPDLASLDEAKIRDVIASVWAELGRLLPEVRLIADRVETTHLEGGWVFAVGTGSLSDPRATLHQRHQVGVHRQGSYFSVDTGKYSIAPWLARQVASSLLDE